jgi:hypothetical protein
MACCAVFALFFALVLSIKATIFRTRNTKNPLQWRLDTPISFLQPSHDKDQP